MALLNLFCRRCRKFALPDSPVPFVFLVLDEFKAFDLQQRQEFRRFDDHFSDRLDYFFLRLARQLL